jgi:tryptophanyl-tRNA synthetase
MSKSIGNTILLADSPDEIQKKLRTAVTDTLKVRKNDPGRPDVCVVFSYHKKFNPGEEQEIRRGCESGALGCVDCKKNCATKIADVLAPIREKRIQYESNPAKILEILHDGEGRGRKEAQATMSRVREVMKIG